MSAKRFVAPEWVGDAFLRELAKRTRRKMAARTRGRREPHATLTELVVTWWERKGRKRWVRAESAVRLAHAVKALP